MRFLYVALFGLALTATSLFNNNNKFVYASSLQASSLDSLFSSDAPDSLHEANNQGTLDEPAKTWPEANSWLHAALTETEKEFFLMTPTGTVSPTAPVNGGITSAQIAQSTGVVTVTIQLNVGTGSLALATALQQDIATYNTGSNLASVGFPALNTVQVGTNSQGPILETTAQFTFSNNPTSGTTAGQQFANFANAFAQSTSQLRGSGSFQNIDLNYYPQFIFSCPTCTTTTTSAPTSTIATTPAPTTYTPPAYCAAHNTACLNGGTCIDGLAGAYSCSCASGYIGPQCQFSLNFTSKRRKVSKNGIARGHSVTRPNVQAKPKSF